METYTHMYTFHMAYNRLNLGILHHQLKGKIQWEYPGWIWIQCWPRDGMTDDAPIKNSGYERRILKVFFFYFSTARPFLEGKNHMATKGGVFDSSLAISLA